jgi:hypothetical protein
MYHHGVDTISDNDQVEGTVDLQTIIEAEPLHSRFVVNEHGIRTPHKLRTVIHLGKQFSCLLLT